MEKEIHVLYITDGLSEGGKERQLVELIKNIDKTVFNIGIVTFNSRQHYSAQARNISSYYRELKKRPTRLEPLFSIWKCFFDFKPDIVHAWDSLSSFYAYLPCVIKKIPFIDGSIRDAGIEKNWEKQFKRFFLKRADMVISNSIAGMKYYGVTGRLVYNSIDRGRFLQKKDLGEFNIVMTARFSKYKDQRTFLLAAIELLKRSIIDRALLLGDGPNKQKYFDWINSDITEYANRIHFLGTVNNVEDYLSNCKIGILCSTASYSEGISNSVLEYMAAGLVPVMTDTGACREIILDGVSGFLFMPRDWRKIVSIVEELKSDQKKFDFVSQNAKKVIEERFDLKENISEYGRIYREIACQKRFK